MTDRGVERHRGQAKKWTIFCKIKFFKGGGWSIWSREKSPKVQSFKEILVDLKVAQAAHLRP